MKKTRILFYYKKISALFLCIALILGLLPVYPKVVRAADTGTNVYTAPELTITKAQETYDLMQDITYDTTAYTLSITDEGGFRVDTVGDYTVAYLLTPMIPSPTPGTEGVPTPPKADTTAISFNRMVHVIETNLCITFTIDTTGLNGTSAAFADGTAQVKVKIPTNSKITKEQLPTVIVSDTGEVLPVTGWTDAAGGMTYTTEQLMASPFTKDEAFLACVAQSVNPIVCTCGAGEQAECHSADCALLHQPENEAIYTEKAGGEPAAIPMGPVLGGRSGGITVPKGMFFLSPSPEQGNVPGSYEWYDKFIDTMNAIDADSNQGNQIDYRIIICKAEQELTIEDIGKTSKFHGLGGRLDGKGGNLPGNDKAKSLTLSASWSDPDGADTLWNRDPATWGANTRLGLQGAPDDAGIITLPTQVDLGVPTTFRNMKLIPATGSKILINAYSQKVVMGEGVENTAGSYIDLFGKTGDPADTTLYDGSTELEVFSGTYHQVCGGYFNAQKQRNSMDEQYIITGDKQVQLYGGNFYAGGTTNTDSNTDILYRNCVVGDSLDDDVQGGNGNVKYSTKGIVSMLVQPMEGLTFVAPPAILLGVYSCSLFPNGTDTLTLDTTYYKQPIDMSRTDIAASPDGSEDGSYPVLDLDGNHSSVRMDINAPQTTLKSLWGRSMAKKNTTNYPATVNIMDIGTVKESVNGSNRVNEQLAHDCSVNDKTTLNISKSVQLNGVSWFSTVNIAENMDLSVNYFEMVLGKMKTYDQAITELNKNTYYTNGFPQLNLAAGSALTVSQGGANCMMGNVNAQASSRISLSCDNYTQDNKAGGMLFGKITAQAAPNQLQIGLSPNSVPLANGDYGFFYLGENDTVAATKVGTIGNLTSVDGAVAHKTNSTKDFITIGPTQNLPIELTSTSTTATACADFAAVKTAITNANKGNEVFKIKLLKPYPMTSADYIALAGITATQCAGLIITGWGNDVGYERKGDGVVSAGETVDAPEAIGTEGAGRNTLYKNTAPPSSNGLTLLATDIQLAVPATFRNISLRSTVTTPISYRAMSAGQNEGYLQIGPGLEQDTKSYMNIYGGRTNFSETDHYNSAVTIYNGKYGTVLSDVDARGETQSNTGASALYIYGGTFGSDQTTPANNIIGATQGTAQHGGGIGRKSEIHLLVSADYNFHLNESPIIGDAYGEARNFGSSNITIQNKDDTCFETFPTVASLDTTYTGATLNGGGTLNINAKNAVFGTITPGNGNEKGPLLTSGTKDLALRIVAAKSIDNIYGGGAAPTSAVNVTPRICTIDFKDGCDTTVKNAMCNWSTLTLEKGTTAPTQVLFQGAPDTFYAANAGAKAKVGTLWLQENTELQLKHPQNRYGINEIKSSGNVADSGTLLVNATTQTPGLTVRGQLSQSPIEIGLVPEVLPQDGTKLLKFETPANADKTQYNKHISIVAGIIQDNKNAMPDGTAAGHGYVFLTKNASVRVYPAPHNGAPGADPMRYTDYITLWDALNDMEKYPAPKGEKYLVNFIKDYTIGYHNKLGELVMEEGADIHDDLEKLKSFKGETAGSGKLKTISFSSIGQNKPELLTENDMKKLNTVDIQNHAKYDRALQLPETNTLGLHHADPAKNEGIIFESFKFGGNCPPSIAANGCTVTMGAFGVANDQPGSVRMTNSDLALYGGAVSTLTVVPESARLVINSGIYDTIRAGSIDLSKQVTGDATVDVNGGMIKTVSGLYTGGVATGNFNNNITVDQVTQFDNVNVNKNLTVTKEMSCRDTNGVNYAGNLTLADNGVLEFQNATTGAIFQAGNLTAGSNSVLLVPKDAGPTGTSVPLQVAGNYTNTKNSTLTVDVKNTNHRVKGDDLIVFAAASLPPTKEQFFSTSMEIGTADTTAPQTIIEYGLPKNPATKLAWVGMPTSETTGSSSKTLYFDSLIYDPENLNADGTSSVDKLFLLSKAQYDAFMAATDKTAGAAMNNASKYTATTTTFTQKENTAPAASDGIGDGVHTHYYSSVTTTIDPNESYYTLTYAGVAWAIAVPDVYSPDTTAVGRTPKAVRDTGIGDEKKFTLHIPLEELNRGVHTPSGIYRIGWSGGKQFISGGVMEPNRLGDYPTNAFSSPPKNGDWTEGASTAYMTQLQDVKPNAKGALLGNVSAYSITVTRAQAKAMKNVYLYVQDVYGNTREITLTPDWQFVADVTYQVGSAGSVPLTATDVYQRNVELNSMVTAMPCPEKFQDQAKTQGYAFAGWSGTKGTGISGTYYPTVDRFKVVEDSTLTAQWLRDDDATKGGDGVPDAWQKTVGFHIASADTTVAGFADTTKLVKRVLPQRKSDGTYTNGFDPKATSANRFVIVDASDVPDTVILDKKWAFTQWTATDTGTTAVTPAGQKIIIPTGADLNYYAQFASDVTGTPQIVHTAVIQNTLPIDSSTTNKTLQFAFAIQPGTGKLDIGNTEISEAFLTKNPWTVGNSAPADKVPITLGGGAANTILGTMTGTVATNSNEADVWYAYVVTNGGKTAGIVLDTTGSTYTQVTAQSGGSISQKTMDAEYQPTGTQTISTDSTATLTLADPGKTSATGYTYQASGLHQAGWTTNRLTTEERTTLCGTNGFTTLQTQNRLTLFPDAQSTVTANAIPDQRLYLYTSDQLGNIRETTVVLTDVYNVSVPTWIGLAAIQGQTNKLITPKEGCFIVNRSVKPVKAEIMNFAVKSGATNQLALVNQAPTKKNEMWLKIQEKTSSLGFPETAVASISTTPLELGTMPSGCDSDGNPVGPKVPHGVGFTFTATYPSDIPLRLKDWDLFTMSYRFTVQP